MCTDPNELGRVVLTLAVVEALEIEYDPAARTPQTLYIPDVSTQPGLYQNQIPNCDILAMKWLYKDTIKSGKFVDFIPATYRYV